MNKAIFFDRDGVLNELVARDGGYFSPRNFSQFVIIEENKKVLEKSKKNGFVNIVVSNQPDISRGLLLKDELRKMSEKLKNELLIDDIFYCTHDDVDNCYCRKPLPGLVINAAEKWNINLGKSLLVGDTKKDVEAAIAINLKYLLLNKHYNRDDPYSNRIENLDDIFFEIGVEE